MKERPILFTGPMVRAILDGRKTQTRRVIKPQPPQYEGGTELGGAGFYDGQRLQLWQWHSLEGDEHFASCPYGIPGDRLWVRETWWSHKSSEIEQAGFDGATVTKLDEGMRHLHSNLRFNPEQYPTVWTKKNPLFMPRWASRITLEIASVRVQRVQDIAEEDAKAEGIVTGPVGLWSGCSESDAHGAVAQYRKLWDSINAKRGFGWNVNPWVWVVEFERITP